MTGPGRILPHGEGRERARSRQSPLPQGAIRTHEGNELRHL